MNNKTILYSIALIVGFLCIIPLTYAESYEINNLSIEINEYDSSYQIKEQFTLNKFDNASYIFFQFPSIANDIKIIVDKTHQAIWEKKDNLDVINVSSLNITSSKITVDTTYYVPSTTIFFEKTFSYNTSSITIKFENSEIYQGNNQLNGTTLKIKLTKLITPESFNLYTIILILLFVVIIIVTSWYGFFKRKNGMDRKRCYESSEHLEIEKTLLLDVLKEIEKMHRNQKISDDSYHKLKGYYKQQTVDIMSALDQTTKKKD